MELSEYDYDFPAELIATEPVSPRSSSRLFHYKAKLDERKHRSFSELADILKSGDVLVLNRSRVLPARFLVQRESGASTEGLFFEFVAPTKALVWLQGKSRVGEVLNFGGELKAIILEKKERDVYIEVEKSAFLAWLERRALPALPPYIRKRRKELGMSENLESDLKNYQSLWAAGSDFYSVAAPTASLHFDREILARISSKGISLEYISLHVGAGTFLPLEKKRIEENTLHAERVEVDPKVWERLLQAKKEGRRIVGVGSTVTRTLESAYQRSQKGEGIESFSTQFFIYPPFQFKMLDALVTNFHQPQSSLLVLIDAFIKFKGGESWRSLYQEAIHEKYRLFSYGDAMLIE